jgi:hypothetical protein
MELVLVSGSLLVMGLTTEVPILGQFSSLPPYFELVVEIDVDFCSTDTVIISNCLSLFVSICRRKRLTDNIYCT